MQLPRTAFSILLRATISLLIAIVVMRLVWGWYEARRLNQYIAQLRATNQPVTQSDIHYDLASLDHDAWPLIDQAGAAVTVDSPRSSVFEFRNYPPYPPEWTAAATASAAGNAIAFTLMDQATTRPTANPPHNFMAMMNKLSPPRGLANTLSDDAIFQHLRGRNALAIKRLEQTYQVAEAMRRDDMMVSQLVATGIDALGDSAAMVIAPRLTLGGTEPVPRKQIEQLMQKLLDIDERNWQALQRSFIRERAFAFDSAPQTADSVWVLRPQANRELLDLLHVCDLFRDATASRTAPQIRATIHPVHPRLAFQRNGLAVSTNRGARNARLILPGPISYDVASSFARYTETNLRQTAGRRCLVISLAIQLFHLDTGRYPATLDELVPKYLSAIPRDPYHDDQPIGYVILKHKDGTNRPVLTFDAAGDVGAPDEPTYEWHQSTKVRGLDVRQYRDVTRFTLKPSTQAVEDDPDKSDGPRQ